MQLELYCEDIYDAIGTDVMAIGGWQKAAGRLWPGMKLNSAYARIKVCAKADGDQKFSPQELVQIAAWAREETGQSAITLHLCDETAYRRPQPVDMDVQKDEVARELSDRLKAVMDFAGSPKVKRLLEG